jgi:hypothetical protein
MTRAIALEVERGDICILVGSLWHGSYPRVLEGKRVALHATFNRLGVQPIEDYRHLSDAWLSEQPSAMTKLLGRQLLFGTSTMKAGGVSLMHARATLRDARN